MMKPSNPDNIALPIAVEDRFLRLCNMHMRTLGTELVPPTYLNRAMLRWRELRARHKSGDLRHTDDEIKATQDIADWTLEMNAALTNTPLQKVDWLAHERG